MYFRREFSVRDLYIYKLPIDGAEFVLGGPHQLRVLFRPPSGDEIKLGYKKDILLCSSQGEWRTNPTVTGILEDLAALRLPRDHRLPDDVVGRWYLNADGGLNADRPLPLDYLPEAAQTFTAQISNELGAAIRRAVTVLRWRWGLSGPHNPFSVRIDQEAFSVDGEHWHPLPLAGWVEIFGQDPFELTDDARHQLSELLSADTEEPLGHELLREAATLRSQAPRSALLVGVSALEVGFKEMVAQLVPEAEWLIENAPSPPVVKMIEEYLPKLPVKRRFGGEVLPPPKFILDRLKAAIHARNRVTHVGGEGLQGESLDQALNMIRDTLYLFDYYRGDEWALEHLSIETRQALAGEP